MDEMGNESHNRLSPAEVERLALLVEELGEAQQAVGKILRHGYHGAHPDDEEKKTNRGRLEEELGHVLFSMSFMEECGDLEMVNIEKSARTKKLCVKKWLHHQ